MDESLAGVLWLQFGAALQTLENTIRACPAAVWDGPEYRVNYWYLAFHPLFWTDYYLSETPDEAQFQPPTPFTTSDFDESGALPKRTYTQAELLSYLDHVRAQAKAFIASLGSGDAGGEKWRQRCGIPGWNYTYLELTLYNMRHVQHHAAQLNLLLRERTDSATDWVSRARS